MPSKLNDEHQTRAQLGGLGRTKLYELTATGEIARVQIGRRRFWPQTAIDEFVESLTASAK